MKISATTIDELFAAAGEREGDLRELDVIIRQTTHLESKFFDGTTITMLAYGMYRYKSVSGREGDWPVIGLANQKNYISLYIGAVKDGKYLAELYGKRLGKVSTGRSCIRFKKLADLNSDVLKEVLVESAKWYDAHKDQAVTSFPTS